MKAINISTIEEKNSVRIHLNNEEFRYDVYQMFNLFFTFEDIEFIEEDSDVYVEILEDSLKIIAKKDNLCKYEIKDKSYKYEFKDNGNYKEELKKGIFIYLKSITEKELPWGTLTGIRPSKRAMKLLDEGKSEDDIVRFYQSTSITREDKAKLCMDIAKLEKNFINVDKKNISIYVGMPFCPTRCLYCSFTSNPIGSSKKLVEPYLEGLKYEIRKVSEFVTENKLNIETVYFGGGTPTAVNDKEFHDVMSEIHREFIKDRNVKEFTLECGRPDSLNTNKLQTMKEFGVHRISINPQTMNNDTLKVIGRNHTSEDIEEIFREARSLNFDNINMDIIVGLPGEDINHIIKTCDSIQKLNPDSYTVHGLSIKRGSRLYEQLVNKMKLEIPEQNHLNMMYDYTFKLADKMDMKPYYMYRQKNMLGNMENIGYSKEGRECIYNMLMIEDTQSIIALGADAVSKIVFPDENRIERVGNNKDIPSYLQNLDEKLEQKFKVLSESIK